MKAVVQQMALPGAHLPRLQVPGARQVVAAAGGRRDQRRLRAVERGDRPQLHRQELRARPHRHQIRAKVTGGRGHVLKTFLIFCYICAEKV